VAEGGTAVATHNSFCICPRNGHGAVMAGRVAPVVTVAVDAAGCPNNGSPVDCRAEVGNAGADTPGDARVIIDVDGAGSYPAAEAGPTARVDIETELHHIVAEQAVLGIIMAGFALHPLISAVHAVGAAVGRRTGAHYAGKEVARFCRRKPVTVIAAAGRGRHEAGTMFMALDAFLGEIPVLGMDFILQFAGAVLVVHGLMVADFADVGGVVYSIGALVVSQDAGRSMIECLGPGEIDLARAGRCGDGGFYPFNVGAVSVAGRAYIARAPCAVLGANIVTIVQHWVRGRTLPR